MLYSDWLWTNAVKPSGMYCPFESGLIPALAGKTINKLPAFVGYLSTSHIQLKFSVWNTMNAGTDRTALKCNIISTMENMMTY